MKHEDPSEDDRPPEPSKPASSISDGIDDQFTKQDMDEFHKSIRRSLLVMFDKLYNDPEYDPYFKDLMRRHDLDEKWVRAFLIELNQSG